jgi:hypothetical protein
MSVHADPHPLAGQTVKLAAGVVAPDLDAGDEFRVEDYWDRVSGQSWGESTNNPAALKYAIRTGLAAAIGGREVPLDDEVLYGKVRGIGHLVHVSEIEAPE